MGHLQNKTAFLSYDLNNMSTEKLLFKKHIFARMKPNYPFLNMRRSIMYELDDVTPLPKIVAIMVVTKTNWKPCFQSSCFAYRVNTEYGPFLGYLYILNCCQGHIGWLHVFLNYLSSISYVCHPLLYYFKITYINFS